MIHYSTSYRSFCSNYKIKWNFLLKKERMGYGNRIVLNCNLQLSENQKGTEKELSIVTAIAIFSSNRF